MTREEIETQEASLTDVMADVMCALRVASHQNAVLHKFVAPHDEVVAEHKGRRFVTRAIEWNGQRYNVTVELP